MASGIQVTFVLRAGNLAYASPTLDLSAELGADAELLGK